MVVLENPMVPRGLKRCADDNLDNGRLTKRFNRMSLAHPKPPSSEPQRRARYDVDGSIRGDVVAPMQVDETRDRIYIADLDAELSSDDASDNQIVFLPEVEKRLTKLPKSLLTDQHPSSLNTHTELVLYSVPSSLSVPAEQDNVRKAIIETRARVRAQQHEQRLAQEHEAGQEMIQAGLSSKMRSEYGLFNDMEMQPTQAMTDVDEMERMREMGNMDDPDAMDIG